MKKIVFVFILLSLGIASAKEVVINYPSFQGKAILARQQFAYRMPEHNIEVDMRVNMACRLAGYARAVNLGLSYGPENTKYKVAPLISSYDFLIPESITNVPNATTSTEWFVLNHFVPKDLDVGFSINKTPIFKKNRKTSQCAEISQCLGYDIKKFRSGGIFDLNYDQPFIKKCHRWGQDVEEPQVFTQITCETSEDPEYKDIEAKMRSFHERTGNKFLVVPGDSISMGIQFQDHAKSCDRYKKYFGGKLSGGKPFECDYNPFPAILSKYGLNVYEPTFMNYIHLTGRYKVGPKVGPPSVQRILNDYSLSVIPEEYAMSPDQIQRMAQPFCVESISEVETSNNNECRFKVKTRDFLQVSGLLEISIGNENAETEISNKCFVLAEDFKNEALSCERANFCPAPGMVNRGQK